MTTAEKIELAVVPLLGGALWLLVPVLPGVVGIGSLLLWAAALFLFQGLVRDLWLLTRQRRTALPGRQRKARCICAESTVGVAGVVVGIAVLCSGMDRPVTMGHWTWSLLGMATMAAGFVLKDYVLEWRPFGLRRERDHLNIAFTWRE